MSPTTERAECARVDRKGEGWWEEQKEIGCTCALEERAGGKWHEG
jgi:hypothetical protein